MNIPKIVNEIGTIEDYGCEINGISVKELFAKYEALGFIYPAKKKRLAKLMPLIEDNWNRLLKITPAILQIVSYQQNNKDFGTMCMLKSSNNGWLNHHGIANKLPAIALAFLTAQQVHLENEEMQSSQIWFRPNNRIMSRICNRALANVPKEFSFNRTLNYLEFCPKKTFSKSREIIIERYATEHKNIFESFLQEERGTAFLEGEELNSNDVELSSLNKIYNQVGLERYRRIWLAFDQSHATLLGVVIAYKGPIGLNFSFLENRCELIIKSTLGKATMKKVVAQLVARITPQYQDFQLGFIPVIAEDNIAQILVQLGGQIIRQYTQYLWTRPGFQDWYFGAVSAFKNILLRAYQQDRLATIK